MSICRVKIRVDTEPEGIRHCVPPDHDIEPILNLFVCRMCFRFRSVLGVFGWSIATSQNPKVRENGLPDEQTLVPANTLPDLYRKGYNIQRRPSTKAHNISPGESSRFSPSPVIETGGGFQHRSLSPPPWCILPSGGLNGNPRVEREGCQGLTTA